MGERLKGKPGHVFTVWGGSKSCSPELYFQPETTEEIKQIVDEARANGKKVRVAGRAHSICDIAMTTDYMISLEKYNKVLSVDKEKCQIQVEAGLSMYKLNTEILPKHGLGVSNQPDTDDISVGGAIAVGGHGAGEAFQILGQMVLAFEIMTSSGDVMTISDQENPDLLPAVRLSLGSLGIILNVTLQCEPAFNLHKKTYYEDFEKVMTSLDSLSSSADHFSFTWLPHTDGGQVAVSSRTDRPVNVKSSFFWEVLVGGTLYSILLWLCTIVPSLFRLVNKLYYHLIFKHTKEQVDRSDNVFRGKIPNVHVAELIIPRYEAASAMRDIRRWVLSQDGPEFPLHALLFFSKSDDAFLSPHCQGDSATITFLVPRVFDKVLPVERTFRAYEQIMLKHGGKPHWSLDNYLTSGQLEKMFPKWNTFQSIRKRLDPTGMFMNHFLDEKFGNS